MGPPHAPRIAHAVAAVGVASAAIGCGSVDEPHGEPIGQIRQEVGAPLPDAYCTVQVDGTGAIDMEENYLPHVIQCENGGANLEALKAQAIAARSVAYYNMATEGSICDSQGCQVYSCGASPGAIHHQAVDETSGMYLSYDDMLTYAFYVAGDSNVSPPSCVGSSGSTEHWVTYNEGKTGADVEQTELGYVSYPILGQNRGCMSQWSARCLENHNGYDYMGILRFFYGDDIQVLSAPGPCVTSNAPDLDASFVSSGSSAPPAFGGSADFEVCTGSIFYFWFEVENTGGVEWVDVSGSAVGSAVRLGVPGGGMDLLTNTDRISVSNNANQQVDPAGEDCNDSAGCRRTRFTGGAGIEATAPSTPGLVTTTWQLVDEGRSWFGPQMSLSFNVVACDAGAGGTGGTGGTAGSGGSGGSGAAAGTSGQAGSGGSDPTDGGAANAGGPSASPAAYYQNDDPDGCACRTSGLTSRPPWVLALAGLLWLRRRRRG